MFSDELSGLFIQVVKSWQVIAVTIILILYICLINYVARSYHRPRFVSQSKPKKVKTAPPAENAETTTPS